VSAWLVATLMTAGSALALLAAVGVWRFPDLLTRMQAAAKAGTLSVGCMMIAAAVHFGRIQATTHAVLIVAFLLLTTPIGAQLIARAGHRTKVPLWAGTHRDELREAEGRRASGSSPGAPEDGPA
jgi:multicomponent Na+:H+ antiporter subunit G